MRTDVGVSHTTCLTGYNDFVVAVCQSSSAAQVQLPVTGGDVVAQAGWSTDSTYREVVGVTGTVVDDHLERIGVCQLDKC